MTLLEKINKIIEQKLLEFAMEDLIDRAIPINVQLHVLNKRDDYIKNRANS